jgi:hypothetical protein
VWRSLEFREPPSTGERALWYVTPTSRFQTRLKAGQGREIFVEKTKSGSDAQVFDVDSLTDRQTENRSQQHLEAGYDQRS